MILRPARFLTLELTSEAIKAVSSDGEKILDPKNTQNPPLMTKNKEAMKNVSLEGGLEHTWTMQNSLF